MEKYRWMGYACWWEPFELEYWCCDRYFCSKHSEHTITVDKSWNRISDEDYKEEDEDDYLFLDCCERCAKGLKPFPRKKEHPTWIKHILSHESRKEWREWHPELVEKYKRDFAEQQ